MVGAVIRNLVAAISACELDGIERSCILREIAPARAIHSRSPFVKRLQDWPRGYPGDWETVEWLISQRNQAPSGTFEHCLETHLLGCLMAQQHRNKVVHQMQLIFNAAFVDPAAHTRILIVASGAAPDLRQLAVPATKTMSAFVLNDSDPTAIEAARQRLTPILDRCTFVTGNVLALTSRLSALGPYELILAGGSFDYLDDRAATLLCRVMLTKLLASDGMFYFSNVARGNPYRYWLEYLADWKLLERSENDVRSLLEPCRNYISEVSIERDATGISMLSHVTRNGKEGPQKSRTTPRTVP